jgi:hypothetical protein
VINRRGYEQAAVLSDVIEEQGYVAIVQQTHSGDFFVLAKHKKSGAPAAAFWVYGPGDVSLGLYGREEDILGKAGLSRLGKERDQTPLTVAEKENLAFEAGKIYASQEVESAAFLRRVTNEIEISTTELWSRANELWNRSELRDQFARGLITGLGQQMEQAGVAPRASQDLKRAGLSLEDLRGTSIGAEFWRGVRDRLGQKSTQSFVADDLVMPALEEILLRRRASSRGGVR